MNESTIYNHNTKTTIEEITHSPGACKAVYVSSRGLKKLKPISQTVITETVEEENIREIIENMEAEGSDHGHRPGYNYARTTENVGRKIQIDGRRNPNQQQYSDRFQPIRVSYNISPAKQPSQVVRLVTTPVKTRRDQISQTDKRKRDRGGSKRPRPEPLPEEPDDKPKEIKFVQMPEFKLVPPSRDNKNLDFECRSIASLTMRGPGSQRGQDGEPHSHRGTGGRGPAAEDGSDSDRERERSADKGQQTDTPQPSVDEFDGSDDGGYRNDGDQETTIFENGDDDDEEYTEYGEEEEEETSYYEDDEPTFAEKRIGTEQGPRYAQKRTRTETPDYDQKRIGTDSPSYAQKRTGTEDDYSYAQKRIGTESPSYAQKRIGTESPSYAQKRIGTDEPITAQKRVGTEEPDYAQKRVGTDEPDYVQKRVGTDEPITAQKRVGTEEPFAENKGFDTADFDDDNNRNNRDYNGQHNIRNEDSDSDQEGRFGQGRRDNQQQTSQVETDNDQSSNQGNRGPGDSDVDLGFPGDLNNQESDQNRRNRQNQKPQTRDQGNDPYKHLKDQGNDPYYGQRDQGNDPYNRPRDQGNDPYDGQKDQGIDPFDGQKDQGTDPFDGQRDQGTDPYNRPRDQGNDPFDGQKDQGTDPYDIQDQQEEPEPNYDDVNDYDYNVRRQTPKKIKHKDPKTLADKKTSTQELEKAEKSEQARKRKNRRRRMDYYVYKQIKEELSRQPGRGPGQTANGVHLKSPLLDIDVFKRRLRRHMDDQFEDYKSRSRSRRYSKTPRKDNPDNKKKLSRTIEDRLQKKQFEDGLRGLFSTQSKLGKSRSPKPRKPASYVEAISEYIASPSEYFPKEPSQLSDVKPFNLSTAKKNKKGKKNELPERKGVTYREGRPYLGDRPLDEIGGSKNSTPPGDKLEQRRRKRRKDGKKKRREPRSKRSRDSKDSGGDEIYYKKFEEWEGKGPNADSGGLRASLADSMRLGSPKTSRNSDMRGSRQFRPRGKDRLEDGDYGFDSSLDKEIRRIEKKLKEKKVPRSNNRYAPRRSGETDGPIEYARKVATEERSFRGSPIKKTVKNLL